MISELLSKQRNLEATRAKLQGQLEKALHDLDLLTEAEMVDPAELVALQGSASNLTAALGRVDSALEAVDRELRAEQAAAEEAALLDRIESAARAADVATALEQRRYADVAAQFERLLESVLAAAEAGRAGRQPLRDLVREHAPALPALDLPTVYVAGREEQTERLVSALAARSVDLSRALEPTAELRFGHILWPLAHEWSRSRSHPLEAA